MKINNDFVDILNKVISVEEEIALIERISENEGDHG